MYLLSQDLQEKQFITSKGKALSVAQIIYELSPLKSIENSLSRKDLLVCSNDSNQTLLKSFSSIYLAVTLYLEYH